MNIIIVEGIDPSKPGPGGIEGYTRNLLSYLHKQQAKTTLIGINGQGYSSAFGGFDFLPVAQAEQISGYRFFLSLLFHVPRMLLPSNAVVHVQRPEYLIPFILFHSKNPKIITLHGRMRESIRLKTSPIVKALYSAFEPFALKYSDIIIAVDQSTKEYYLNVYPWLSDKMRVISVGIDLEKFKLLDRNKLRITYGFDPNDKVIIYLGRLEKEKNLEFLLSCYSELEKQIPNAILLMVGEGRERPKLKQLAIDLDLKRIKFMGAQRPDTIPEILNCCDALVLCSLFEGSPTVIKEALSCGVPVVSTDVGDVKSNITDPDTGMVVKPDRFVSGCLSVLKTSDREKQRTACAKFSTAFSFDHMGSQTMAIYGYLLSQRNSKQRNRIGKPRT